VRITEYLDHALGTHKRVLDMTALADKVAEGPTSEVLGDLAAVLEARTLTGEDLLRLNILLSQLYHAKPDIDGDLDAELRDRVSTVWERSRIRPSRREVITMSCSNPDCRKMGCSTEPRPPQDGGRRT
jgi:hypothetical protein